MGNQTASHLTPLELAYATLKAIKTRSTHYSDVVHLNEMVFLLSTVGEKAVLKARSFDLIPCHSFDRCHSQNGAKNQMDLILLSYQGKNYDIKGETTWEKVSNAHQKENYASFKIGEHIDLGEVSFSISKAKKLTLLTAWHKIQAEIESQNLDQSTMDIYHKKSGMRL